MSLTLVAEDGSGKADANSYVTLAFARSFIEEQRPYPPKAWTTGDDVAKTTLCVGASRVLDATVIGKNGGFKGSRAHGLQALEWPRIYCPDPRGPVVTDPFRGLLSFTGIYIAGDIVPPFIQMAACELVRAFCEKDFTHDPIIGIESVSVGGISVNISSARIGGGMPPIQYLPEIVKTLISPYTNRSAGMARVVRA